MRERENELGHFNYAHVMYLFVTPSVLQSERERERERERDNELGYI